MELGIYNISSPSTCVDIRNSTEGHIKFFGYVPVVVSFSQQFLNFVNILIRKLEISISPFLYHISHVVKLCSKKQMFWINTYRIITLMQYINCRHFTKCQVPRNSMSGIGFVIKFYSTVAASCFVSYPKPACFSFFNITPKSFDLFFCKWLHAEHHIKLFGSKSRNLIYA